MLFSRRIYIIIQWCSAEEPRLFKLFNFALGIAQFAEYLFRLGSRGEGHTDAFIHRLRVGEFDGIGELFNVKG